MIRARVHPGLRWIVGSEVATAGLWAQNENTLSKMIRKIDPRFTTIALFFPASKKRISLAHVPSSRIYLDDHVIVNLDE